MKVAPGLRVGYVMGTGDTVPDAIQALGITTHLVTDDELATADLSQWNVLVARHSRVLRAARACSG